MANGIQVPQTTPNAPQFQVPTDLVNSYLNRKQQGQQFLAGQMGELGGAVNEYQQQKITNQLNALKAYADIAGTSGITAANQIAPNIPGGMNTQNLPTDPFAQFQDPNAPPTPPQPQQPPPSGPPPTAGTPDASGAPVIAPQDTQPSQAIALSAAAGHPVNPGLASLHVPQPETAGTQNGIQGLPTLAPQMARNNALIQQASQVGGSYAANRVKNLSAVNTGLAAQDTAMQAPVKFAQEQKNFQQGKAQEQANFDTAQANEKQKVVAGEVSKQGPLTTEVKTLQGMFDNVDKNLGSYYQGNNYPGSANLQQITKGRVGSQAGATVLNQSAPLVAAINKSLTSRFNMGENELLSGTIAPSPNDTPKYAASKMAMLHQLIQAIDSGNKENVRAVAASIGAQVPAGVNGQNGQQ